LSATAAADIYTFVDKDGVIHFQNHKKRGKLVAKERKVAPAIWGSGEDPVDSHRYDEHIREAAALYQIPEALIRAVMKVESNFNPRAISPANAHGLMQLMPGTAERMMVSDIFDPRQNILGGVRYLRVLANMFNGNLELTIAGYNAGENAVLRYGGIPPYDETRAYVTKVLIQYQIYRNQTWPS
jgi:soluble lytic murein transglycosylase-like protein